MDDRIRLRFADPSSAAKALAEPLHYIPLRTSQNEARTEPISIQTKATHGKGPTEEISVQLYVKRDPKEDGVQHRTKKMLRTNVIVQSRANKYLMRGFEGFHGELRTLWDKIGHDTTEDTLKKMAQDQIRDKRTTGRQKGETEKMAVGLLKSADTDMALETLGSRLKETEELLEDVRNELQLTQTGPVERDNEPITVDAVQVELNEGMVGGGVNEVSQVTGDIETTLQQLSEQMKKAYNAMSYLRRKVKAELEEVSEKPVSEGSEFKSEVSEGEGTPEEAQKIEVQI